MYFRGLKGLKGLKVLWFYGFVKGVRFWAPFFDSRHFCNAMY